MSKSVSPPIPFPLLRRATGEVTECGMTLAAYQAKGGDPGTVAAPYPDDSVILGIARKLMNL